MKQEVVDRLKQKASLLPTSAGVYKMLDMYANIIYIGKAKNLKNRVSSYFVNTAKLPKVQQMLENVVDFDYIVTLSEIEALNLESNLIREHMPFYNILLKDGKAFPYIKIDIKSDYPRAVITRRVLNDGALYFGPYFNKISATSLLKIIHSTFKIRDCNLNMNKKHKRECLNYFIGQCLAPCTRRCTKEEYAQEVQKVVSFLKGDLHESRKIMEEKMRTFAGMEMFEKAMEVRDSLKELEFIDARNVTGLTKNTDIDVFGFAENGHTGVVTIGYIRGTKMIGLSNYNIIEASDNAEEILTKFITQYYLSKKIVPQNVVTRYGNDTLSEWLCNHAGKKINLSLGSRGTFKRLLQMCDDNASEHLNVSIEKDKLYELKTIGALKTLQSTLKLSSLPKRIEGFDISNLGGTNTVGSMVVFVNGVKAPKMYRKFKISSASQNDFQNMHDILYRRLSEYKQGKDLSFGTYPNLIVIDGGVGQLSSAKQALDAHQLDIDVIALSERHDEICLVDGRQIRLSKDNFGLKLLQNIRDESHRFAITFQKNLRTKNTLKSKLSEIELIGSKKIDALFAHFKSFDKISKATISDLMQVTGIGKKLAENIYNYFNKNPTN